MKGLDERSGEIFRRIVDSYLASGEPLGSRSLSRLLPMSLSPASVRNVMSDLEELGLIYSPHVSAGRLPTQTGLRFFVDAFMQVGDISDEDRASIARHVHRPVHGQSVETISQPMVQDIVMVGMPRQQEGTSAACAPCPGTEQAGGL